jgi:hypothetical protein
MQARLDEIEDRLAAGLPPGQVDRALAQKHGISVRQARNLRQKVYARWREETLGDAPHRREKLIRMVERHYALAMRGETVTFPDGSTKSVRPWTAATSTLRLLAEMSGAFAQYDPEREARIAELGPPPSDPTQALVWGQRCLVLQLDEVMRNAAIEPERKTRLVADLVAKLGMTHAKALVEAKLNAIEGRLLGAAPADADQLEEWGGALPSTARLGADDPRHEQVPRHGPPPASTDDTGDPPGGGRPLGPG